MKVMNAFIIVVSLLLGVACNEQKENIQEEETVVAAVTPNATTTLDIDGMTCEMGCKAAIEKHMNKTKGVAVCAVDFDKSLAVIEYDNQLISEEELIAEIGEVANHAYSAKKHTEATESLAE